jgi:hypothetical protein
VGPADDLSDRRLQILFTNYCHNLGLEVVGWDQRDGLVKTVRRPRERARLHSEVILTARTKISPGCCGARQQCMLERHTVTQASDAICTAPLIDTCAKARY